MGNCAQSTGGNFLGVKLDNLVLEVETLLDDGGQLPDTPALLTQNALRVCGQEDDFNPAWGDADLHTGVSILGELTSEELVQLCLEDAVSNELKEREEKKAMNYFEFQYFV